ncbi:PilX N-terminal domain-containing pilus assembly protein [Desulfurivibrio dismutans]|uniref:PilX N-terminal domain-containing pilus assembly protein n=1 Tax=Desulfurivibrio dismutans TaxID=1398908 RepID=UPI0023D9B601|nr:PilX N-terminal domain-containing pilus assembly protein [Desulfurivibrio alkaliphilus]MDF1615694.1 PilX N-terminal domain-containing pilus assembly protein [Desulfurivibrio alkaliphilus]
MQKPNHYIPAAGAIIATGGASRRQAAKPASDQGMSPAAARHRRPQEGGFVLVGALLIMLVLVLIGISATTSTNLELQIAGVDKSHTETFFHTDGGVEMATMLLEENIICAGFAAGTGDTDRQIGPLLVYFDTLSFWEQDPPEFPADILAFADDPVGQADFIMNDFPWQTPDPNRRTSVRMGGQSVEAFGGAQQMAAGYVGVGKAAGSGYSSSLVYDIYVHHQGPQNTEKMLQVRWRAYGMLESGCRVD